MVLDHNKEYKFREITKIEYFCGKCNKIIGKNFFCNNCEIQFSGDLEIEF